MLTVFLSGGVTVLFLIPLLYPIPLWAKLVSVLFAVYVVYLTLKLAWCLSEPADASVSLKPRAIEAEQKCLCSVCGKDPQGSRTLEVGYRGKSLAANYLGVLIGGYMEDAIHLSVPICEHCARRYAALSKLQLLPLLGLDRSFRVLKRKPGYLRGLEHPFDRSNLRTVH